jgi:hypothetical protein
MVGFPLLLIPLAIYNIIVFLMPGVSLAEPLVKLPLMSGAEWPLTLSDMLLALGIVVLLLEVIKGARPGAKYLTDHLLSLMRCARDAGRRLWQPLRSRGVGREKPMPSRPNRSSILRLRRQRRPLLRHRCQRPLRSPNPCR